MKQLGKLADFTDTTSTLFSLVMNGNQPQLRGSGQRGDSWYLSKNLSPPQNIEDMKRSREQPDGEEAMEDAQHVLGGNFADDAADDLGTTAGMGSGGGIAQMGGTQLTSRLYPMKFLNWRRGSQHWDILNYMFPRIKWDEYLITGTAATPGLQNNISGDAAGIRLSSGLGREAWISNDGRFNNFGGTNRTVIDTTAAVSFQGWNYLSLFTQAELFAKYKKMQVTYNIFQNLSARDISERQNGGPTLYIDDFQRKYTFCNINNTAVKMEIWELICMDSCPANYGPLQCLHMDWQTKNQSITQLAPGTSDPSGFNPRQYYLGPPSWPGNRPDRNDKTFHRYWRCLKKSVFFMPGGTTVTYVISGNLTIRPEKIMEDNDGVTGPMYLSHVSRTLLIFLEGQNGRVTQNTTGGMPGMLLPTTADVSVKVVQGGTYRAIPRNIEHAKIVTAWFDRTETTNIDPTQPVSAVNAVNIPTTSTNNPSNTGTNTIL